MTEEEDADQLLAMKWANETVPSWRNTYDLIRRVRSEERESRLRAEREREDWREAARLTRETVTVLADQKAALRKALATAEREGDEARAQMYAATTATAKREEDVAYAQKRIEELEAVLRGWWCGNHECSRSLCRNIDAALSSPAVTAEGKKLGEEGGGA